jgi:plastocyanin
MRSGWMVAWVLGVALGGPARAGDVTGTVEFTGDGSPRAALTVTKDGQACGAGVPDESLLVANGRLANVVVTVKGAPPAPPSAVTLDQQRCRYVPHVQTAPLGSTLEIVNSDPVLHNSHGWLGRMTRFNVPTPEKGMRVPARLDRAGLVQVRCDVHGWMSAYVVVPDGRAAVAGADGSFTIRDVPAGTYAVTAWHERLGEKTVQVTVPAQGEARVQFSYGG